MSAGNVTITVSSHVEPTERTRPTVREVVDKLTAQGSADQIAAFFRTESVTGTPCASFDCPVATYVRAQTGDEIHATPMRIHAIADEPIDHVLLHGVGPVADFIIKFDFGEYPELDALQGAF